MRREDFVFCIGYEGATAIVDGRMMRQYRSHSTVQLAEKGLFKQALCSALFAGEDKELEDVLALYNKQTQSSVRTVEELKRIFGVSAIPEGVKKVTVV